MTRTAQAHQLYAQGKTPREVSDVMGIGLDSARNLKYKPASSREARAPIPAATEAACVALLKDGRTTRAIANELHISPASVYAIRDRNGIGVNRRKKRHVMADQDTREGLPTCPWCPMLAPCTCTGPMRAADFIGRAGEPRGSLVLPRPF